MNGGTTGNGTATAEPGRLLLALVRLVGWAITSRGMPWCAHGRACKACRDGMPSRSQFSTGLSTESHVFARRERRVRYAGQSMAARTPVRRRAHGARRYPAAVCRPAVMTAARECVAHVVWAFPAMPCRSFAHGYRLLSESIIPVSHIGSPIFRTATFFPADRQNEGVCEPRCIFADAHVAGENDSRFTCACERKLCEVSLTV